MWALIQLQLHTAACGGELVPMRPIDLDTNGEVWTYTPADHKNLYRGHQRTIYIGPRAQAIIREFIVDRPVDAYLLSPIDAQAERRANARTRRHPRQPQTPRKTNRKLGSHYTSPSYRRAIERACRLAEVPVWAPHRLRHNAASNLRGEYGIDVAQTILGHRLGSAITEVYAEANVAKAIEIIGKVG